MKRALFAIAAVALCVGVARADWPSGPAAITGCSREVVTYTAFIPKAIQDRLADAGYPLTPTLIPYKRLQGRAWLCPLPDGGTIFYPPRLARLAEYFRPDLTTVADPTCSDVTLCPGTDSQGNDSTADALTEQTFECACSAGPTCKWTDGGAATQSVTLSAGSFTPSVACRPKACGTLWVGSGADFSWPPACP